MTADALDRRTERSWAEDAQRPALSLMEALGAARRAVGEMTDQPIDGVAGSERMAEGGWKVTIETIEGPARMGDNDLLAAYDVELSADGELTGFKRIARYHREDGTP